jgi:hypothetical protein
MPNIFVGLKALLFGVVGNANERAKFELNLPPCRSLALPQSSVFDPFYLVTFTSAIVASCDTKTPNTTTTTGDVTDSANWMPLPFPGIKPPQYLSSNSAD